MRRQILLVRVEVFGFSILLYCACAIVLFVYKRMIFVAYLSSKVIVY